MQPKVFFSCTALAGTQKNGILNKDENGYRTMPIGGLNCFNSAGQYYPYEAAKNLFESSSSFMRRVSTGCLKAEEGHPKPAPQQSETDFANRIRRIEETRVCAHIAEVYLDFNSLRDDKGRPIVAIMGKVAPSGPFGEALEKSFNNPKEDVCFSIRSFTENKYIAGVLQKEIAEIITFDRVTEPGIYTSRKFKAPSLESLNEMSFTKETLENSTKIHYSNVSLENNILSTYALFKSLGWDTSHLEAPKFMKW